MEFAKLTPQFNELTEQTATTSNCDFFFTKPKTLPL